MAKKKKTPLWERQEWDSRASFNYFHKYYLSQIAPRSLNKAYRMARSDKGIKEASNKHAPGAWKNWHTAKNYSGKSIKGAVGWLDRANAWDDHCAKHDIDQWEKRRKEVREQDWKIGKDLRDLAVEILEHGPNYIIERHRTVRGNKDQPDQIIITLALDINAAVKAGKLGSDLQRLAAEMATDRHEGEFDIREHVKIIIPDNQRGDRGEDEV